MSPESIALLASAVETVAYTAFDFFTTSESERLIEAQKQINQENKLRASGVFSDADIGNILRDYNDQVNQAAGKVAARGLGTSPLGAYQIGKAQQAPFFQAQRNAAKQYQQGLGTLSGLISQNRAIEARQRKGLGALTKLGLMFYGGGDK